MKYFGTDGIRGVFGEDLTLELASKTARAMVTYAPKKIVIGRDTRESGLAIVNAMIAEFGGIDVVNVGVSPTMAISFLTKKLACDYGIMITASHNPPKYNGIKIYAKGGVILNGKALEDLDGLVGK